MPDTVLLITGSVSILATTGFLYLFYRLRLVTEVGKDAIPLRFWPLARRQIDFAIIRSCRPVTYRPIRDFGGWGIRDGKKGKAYSVGGNKGAEHVVAEGKPLLIGSQHPGALAATINAGLATK